MTRSNMHITFSNGKAIICVLDSMKAYEDFLRKEGFSEQAITEYVSDRKMNYYGSN